MKTIVDWLGLLFYPLFVLAQLLFTAMVGALFLALLWALGLDWLWR